MIARILLTLGFALTLALVVGCSSDDDSSPTGPANPTGGFQDTSIQNSSTGVWTTTLDASSHTTPATFSFDDVKANGWDISFQRSVINLNGGDAGTGGVVGADLGAIDFASVMIDDTAGVTWEEDVARYVIDSFYTYDFITHQIEMTGYVYAMLDAEGDNFVKFRVDSITGGGAPPNMGTVWLTYVYQPTANSTDLSGATKTGSVTVGMTEGYFDFSSGSQVTPSTPNNSAEWDLKFAAYEIMQNCGPNGSGSCAVFPAYTELGSKDDIDAFAAMPANAQMFPDFVGSVFNGSLTDGNELWYDYDGQTHTLSSKSHVYLVRTADAVYKLEIESYYADINGTLQSGYYTLKWQEL
ncbi:hypothetical protein GF420_13615 [candidate division GN15 bacterium]|nr:hypothetical protein [candidate division GN15 bacterium]